MSKSDIISPFHFRRHTGYYTTKGNDTNLRLRHRFLLDSSNSLSLRFWRVHETEFQGLFSLQGTLTLRTSVTYYSGRDFRGNRSSYYPPSSMNRLDPEKFRRSSSWPTFSLSGFWSESSGKLCMVGFGSGAKRDESFNVPASLKLFNIKNSTKLTSLVTGTLESLVSENDPNYFDPASVMIFPMLNYEYTLVAEEFNNSNNKNGFDDQNDVIPPGLSYNSLPRVLCSLIFFETFDLKYSTQTSTPLGESLSDSRRVLWLERIQCLGVERKLRLLIKFPTSVSDLWNYRTLDPHTTLVGEGIWDEKKNQLNVIACQFLDAKDSWAEAHVGDCSTRLILRFPAIWTIGKTSSVVGYVWSNKTETEFGYFEKIRFESPKNYYWEGAMGLNYEYTKLEKVKKWCPRKVFPENNEEKVYPKGFSNDMRFDLFVRSAGRKQGRGFVKPLYVGNRFYNKQALYPTHFPHSNHSDVEPSKDLSSVKPINISYEINLRLHSAVSQVNESLSSLKISAEGIYDETTGSLCMVGCINVGLNSSKLWSKDGSVDCEIHVNFQFPARHPKENSGYIKGTIESKRKRSDPLHFETLELSSAAFVANEAHDIILRTDVETIMAIISNTLACVFAVLQIFHLRKNPDVVPFVSLTMLLTLTSAYTIPLMLDLKSIFTTSLNTQNALLGIGGWLEAKQITEGVIKVALFLFQARLLQLTWLARRSSGGDSNGLQMAEKEAMFVTLPVYAGWAFLSIFFTWRKRKHDFVMPSSAFLTSYKEHPIWDTMKSCADILLDGFLLPQILLNLFRDSREVSLAYSYYIGTTLVRILPHAYGLYKAQNSASKLVSIAWDVVITLGSLIFATVIYLQQRFGGRFRPKKSGVYEKVANVGDGEI
ncbi:uncharacterized protein LOC133796787 [Humulus lupulus]|uniref:uncharacterized protein LOC133796787 n=1 Tax=Humulus lupulus TaxID=3486 RepID=UPI002B4041E3|nr:uncharacterized protein LOC133796787 [Humulus lupulus]